MDDIEEFVMINHVIDQLQDAELEHEREPRRRHTFESAFLLSDENFVKNFRLTKNLARQVIEIVRPFVAAPSRRSAMTVETKVSIRK